MRNPVVVRRDVRSWLLTQSWALPLLPVYRWARDQVGLAKRACRRLLSIVVHVPLVIWHLYWLEHHGKQHIGANRARASGRKRIVMLACSQLDVDPRIEREARALAAAGWPVTVVCPAWLPPPQQCRAPNWGQGIEFRILTWQAGYFNNHFPYLFGARLLAGACAEDAVAYHGHDLGTALATLVAAARRGVPAVCDFHEWYSENVSYFPRQQRYLPHPFYKRWLFRLMERTALHSASAVITVCDSIAERLVAEYDGPRPVQVIRNIPPLQDGKRLSEVELARYRAEFRRQHGLPENCKIVLYQGGLGASRNLEPVIAAMAQVKDAVFVIRGPGYESCARGYLELAERVGAKGKVLCLPAVPSDQVVAEARVADLGLWTLLANVGLNFELALPNKVFEYLAAGLPLLAADLPEVRKLVNRYEVGCLFDLTSPDDIARAINRLVHDDAYRAQCRENAPRALEDLQADKEWTRLVDLYQQIQQESACGSCTVQ